MSSFLLAIDQGTTSTRAMVFDAHINCIGWHQIALPQHFPALGWVEHDPEDIWQATLRCCQEVMQKTHLSFKNIVGIGIANQRESVVLWDRASGIPIHSVIVWQDRRGAPLCDMLRNKGHEPAIQAKTGLILDSYFSASKICWLLDHVPQARQRAEAGELAFGTIDCFLLWRLTQGASHKTDATNASRTLLFNIHTHEWDHELLKLFNIPACILPEVTTNTAEFGHTDPKLLGGKIPILAMAGDQQAALVGQACFQTGMAKSTYGTGTFLMLNTGEIPVISHHRLLTTLAYHTTDTTHYALEGSVFSAGSTMQWLRDNLKLFKHAAESESLAASLKDNGGVYFVPAFTGLGAPYWAPNVRASIQGITRDTQPAHIVRAALEAVAYQTCDLLEAMKHDSQIQLTEMRVDGGMVANSWLMQFLADLLNLTIERCNNNELTAVGIAYLAGLQAGMLSSFEQINTLWHSSKRFEPQRGKTTHIELYKQWKQVISHTSS